MKSRLRNWPRFLVYKKKLKKLLTRSKIYNIINNVANKYITNAGVV